MGEVSSIGRRKELTRRVVGWAMAATQDAALVQQALSMALTQRKPTAGLLHHSDRGCHYTSEASSDVSQEAQDPNQHESQRQLLG